MLPNAQPKPRPHRLVTDGRQRDWKAIDDAESIRVRHRSGGRCEVTIGLRRCNRRAAEVHHHIGGWKLRGRGESARAENKTHACTACHRLVTGNVLQHVCGNRYRRVE